MQEATGSQKTGHLSTYATTRFSGEARLPLPGTIVNQAPRLLDLNPDGIARSPSKEGGQRVKS